MKYLQLTLIALCTSVGLFSCKGPDDAQPLKPYGSLKVSFANQVDGQPIALGSGQYTNAAGNKYSVDLLKYYITNFTLIKSDSTEHNFKNYALIDAEDSSSLSFNLDSVANGEYTAVKFYLGVDADHNHTGAQEGALDPVHGMIWSWKTGYIFFKHEGHYTNSTGGTDPILFHFGTDDALTAITVPITPLSVSGNSRGLVLSFNLNSVYSSPNDIDFNVDNNHNSSTLADAVWIIKTSVNMGDAFSYLRAE